MRMISFIVLSFLITTAQNPASAFMGTELGPLLQLVAGQVREIERLTESIGIAKDQRDILIRINDGINRTVYQIQSIQSIIERSQGLDPKSIRTLSELNDYLDQVKSIRMTLDDVLGVKTQMAGVMVQQSAVQSETAYLMGQEMIGVGADLSRESMSASPGRADQITAASSSAQMLSQGVQLQTLSHIVQLQAMSLELQRTEIENRVKEKKIRNDAFKNHLLLSRNQSSKQKRTIR